MILLGHWATAVLLADLTDSDTTAAIAGTLLPDVIDKTGGWVLKVMPSGRWLAHGLPFFAVTAAATLPFLKAPRWRGFVLGYASHLAGDLYAGGKVPWFAPFEPVRRGKKRRINVLGTAGAAFLWWRLHRNSPTSPLLDGVPRKNGRYRRRP